VQCSTGSTESQGSQGQILRGSGKLLVFYHSSSLLPVVQIVMQTYHVGMVLHSGESMVGESICICPDTPGLAKCMPCKSFNPDKSGLSSK